MTCNAAQLQKALSELAFDQRYRTEEQYCAVMVVWREPDEFWCPACGGREHRMVTTRDLFQCTACHRQTAPIAWTIFASTKLRVRSWFRAIYYLTQSKQGIRYRRGVGWAGIPDGTAAQQRLNPPRLAGRRVMLSAHGPSQTAPAGPELPCSPAQGTADRGATVAPADCTPGNTRYHVATATTPMFREAGSSGYHPEP